MWYPIIYLSYIFPYQPLLSDLFHSAASFNNPPPEGFLQLCPAVPTDHGQLLDHAGAYPRKKENTYIHIPYLLHTHMYFTYVNIQINVYMLYIYIYLNVYITHFWSSEHMSYKPSVFVSFTHFGVQFWRKPV